MDYLDHLYVQYGCDKASSFRDLLGKQSVQ